MLHPNCSSIGERLEYATAPTPFGPFTSHGVLMDYTGLWTNHGSIVEFRGQWYLFYHMDTLSKDHLRRSVAIEPLHFNEDGTMRLVQPTLEGAPSAPPAPKALARRQQQLRAAGTAVVHAMQAQGLFSAESASGAALQQAVGNASIAQQQSWIWETVKPQLNRKSGDGGGLRCAGCRVTPTDVNCLFQPTLCGDQVQ